MATSHTILLSALLACPLILCSMAPKDGRNLRLKEDNIEEVLAELTLKEKASIVVGAGWGSMLGSGILSSEKILVPGAAGLTRSVDRLGIPSVVLSDGPAGVRIAPKRKKTKDTFYCTGFPVGTLLACSWNEDLVSEVGAAMGNEVLEYGVDVILGPGMNLHRNPLNGRNFEYYSEDPLLTGKTAAAMIRGIQSQGVGTSAKHYAANSQETNRNANDAIVSERALRELYLKGFEIAVKEAAPWTIMSSYNKLNGTFTQEHRWLLTDVLRDDWGFNGIVMTDWTSKRNTAAQIAAGNDLMEPGFGSQVRDLVKKVKKGELDEKELDICVKRVLELIVKTPTFKGYRYSNKPDLNAHSGVSRKAATEGMVLLKNNAALPLPSAGSVALFGVTAYDIIAGGTGSGNVNKPYVVNLADGFSNAGYAVDKSLSGSYLAYTSDKKNRKSGFVMVGEPIFKEMPLSRQQIDATVAGNDYAIFTIGRQAGESEDRAVEDDFLLSDQERQILSDICEAYHSKGKKVVVVLNVGGVVETASWKDMPDAILVAWGPGQEAGNAIADVLSGKVNPSGKLSMTFPVNYADHLSSKNFPAGVKSTSKDLLSTMTGKVKDSGRKDIDYTEYSEGIYVGYRHFGTNGVKVSYPFGFGLSYTSFSYSEPACSVDADGNVTVSVKVTNTGSVAGKEAVQLYVSAPAGGLDKPLCELKAYAKTKELAPGQSQVLTMGVTPYMLASFNEKNHRWETAGGSYTALIGASVEDIRHTLEFPLAYQEF